MTPNSGPYLIASDFHLLQSFSCELPTYKPRRAVSLPVATHLIQMMKCSSPGLVTDRIKPVPPPFRLECCQRPESKRCPRPHLDVPFRRSVKLNCTFVTISLHDESPVKFRRWTSSCREGGGCADGDRELLWSRGRTIGSLRWRRRNVRRIRLGG